jgi:hypothetical protein
MRLYIRNNLFLLVSVLLLVVALLLSNLWMNDYKVNQENLLQSITKKVNKEMAVIEIDLENVSNLLKKPEELSFYKLNIYTKYPYYIYRGGRIMYWSSNRNVPDYNSVKGTYQHKFVVLDNGKFIACKKDLKVAETDYEIVFLLPIYQKSFVNNKYISSGYNEGLFSASKVFVRGVGQELTHQVKSEKGEVLFSIEFSDNTTITNPYFKIIFVFLLVLCLVFFFIYIFKVIRHLPSTNKYDFGFLIIVFSILLVRGLMLYFNFPYSFFKINLFSSKYYASSVITPSLGDLLLNIISLCILSWFVFINYTKFNLYQKGNGAKVGVQGRILYTSRCLILCCVEFPCFRSKNHIIQFTVESRYHSGYRSFVA